MAAGIFTEAEDFAAGRAGLPVDREDLPEGWDGLSDTSDGIATSGNGLSSTTGMALDISFWISRSRPFSSWSQNEIAIPPSPARPVLPILCTYVSGTSGRSKMMTWDNSSTSIPLAAISVATRILVFLDLKLLSANCLAFCDLLP